MRSIDADAIPYTMLYKENWQKCTGYEARGAWKKDIDALPTIDAVEVVRCKDCKFTEPKHTWYCVKRQNVVNGDDFCSWGERRENK